MLDLNDTMRYTFIIKIRKRTVMEWSPRESLKTPPTIGQRVFYFFEPFAHWNVGEYFDGGFSGRCGFCDHYDAPWWHPVPDQPTDLPMVRAIATDPPELDTVAFFCVDSEWLVGTWNGTLVLVRDGFKTVMFEMIAEWWMPFPPDPEIG